MPTTTTDPAVALALWMQLHDGAFPAGRMVHSHGLEEWLTERPDAGPAQIGAAVTDYLANCYAPLDATITAAAWRATPASDELRVLDELTATYKLFDNVRIASEYAGKQLAAVAAQTGLADGLAYFDAVNDGTSPGHCAVVEGALQASLGIPLHTAVLGSLRSMMASMLSAAVRLGRLGPIHSQRIQARAATGIVSLAHVACGRGIDEVWSTGPALEISGMRHETRAGRLFTT